MEWMADIMIYLTNHGPRAPWAGLDRTRCERPHGRSRGRVSRPPTWGSASREKELAWTLADAAGRYLGTVQRNDVFVAIGIGDALTAIRLLLDAITRAGSTVEEGLATRLSSWLDSYTGHDDEPLVRRLIRQAVRGQAEEPAATGVDRVSLLDHVV